MPRAPVEGLQSTGTLNSELSVTQLWYSTVARDFNLCYVARDARNFLIATLVIALDECRHDG
jgi:hypothetical protein